MALPLHSGGTEALLGMDPRPSQRATAWHTAVSAAPPPESTRAAACSSEALAKWSSVDTQPTEAHNRPQEPPGRPLAQPSPLSSEPRQEGAASDPRTFSEPSHSGPPPPAQGP